MDADGGSERRRRRWPWICLAAGLAAFLSVAAALSVAAGGPGPGLAASAAPAASAVTVHPSLRPCPAAYCSVVILAAPAHPLSADLNARMKPVADAVAAVLSAIDWCAYPEHQPCGGGASRMLTGSDVTIVRDALDRAGYRTADVRLTDSSYPALRYTVAVGPACVTGYLLFAQAAPIGNTVYAADRSGRCTL